MAISAAQVKELREKTGAGMLDCKKALEESNGDFEKAIEILRKKGAAVAAKRAERTASEGLILTKVFDNGKSAAILEVNCETDFVAKSDDFVKFAETALELLLKHKPENVEMLLNLSINGNTLKDALNEITGKIGEKIEISRFDIVNVENGLIVDYVHHGSKLGVLLAAEYAPHDKKDELAVILKDIAMQIAAMKPLTIYREEVDKGLIEKELEIYKEVARKEGKPEQVLEKIATGKLNKFFEENCLVEQVFVKDNTKKVGALIDEFNKANGAQVKLKTFRRYHTSDEKK
ncbi:translation elongation factor Ts [Melioribacter sp. OK-6-Me]|uniref:translation elongation factor Ts n=1 Tax=unclassified Melioribacter TaxID=2627329 RepID=UPI003ED9E019